MNILDLGINYGTVTTLNFNTTINITFSGLEQRVANWDQPLLSFELGNRSLDNDELIYLQNFFDARQGSYETFLFKDWSDYKATNQFIQLTDGLNNYQLVKTYNIEGNLVNRIITKPNIETIEIFIDGFKQTSGYLVDPLTGIITLSSSGIITANFEFYVPVRFVQDKIDYRFQGYEKATKNKIYNLENLSLLEVKETPIIDLININEGAYNFIIDLGYDYETLGGEAYNTTINQVASGFESRRKNWLNSLGSWDIGQRKLNKAELNHLIAAFRVCRGQFGNFFYKDWKDNKNQSVRFAEDQLSFRFDAIELSTEQVIFDLAGFSLKKILTLGETYFIASYDTSSLGQPLATIIVALTQFKQILADNNLYGSQENLDKYYQSGNFTIERYLRTFLTDYREETTEPIRYQFLIFLDESIDDYHTHPRNTSLEPTTTWLNDFADFQAMYETMESFEALFIVPSLNATFRPDMTSFYNHLIDAINGIGNYENYALKNFNISVQQIDYNASSQDYVDLLIDFFSI